MLPDIALSKGGTGEAIFRRLLHESDAHTQMPLPTRALYVQDVKAEVLLLLDRKPATETPWTREPWIYELHTNQGLTLKKTRRLWPTLTTSCLATVSVSRRQWVESEQFGRFTYEELPQLDKANLHIFSLRDESLNASENLPPSDQTSEEIMEDLQPELEQLE